MVCGAPGSAWAPPTNSSERLLLLSGPELESWAAGEVKQRQGNDQAQEKCVWSVPERWDKRATPLLFLVLKRKSATFSGAFRGCARVSVRLG